tara:strand:- start:2446 stop:3087 length:642 start_codon:yes stop_codon:yes gene_type:complete
LQKHVQFSKPAQRFYSINLRTVVLGFIFFFAFGIAGYALILPLLGFSGPIHTRLAALPAVFFYSHTVGGAWALMLAPFQLLKPSKRKWHKVRGYLYVISVVISSIGGFYMAQDAYGGLSSVFALSLLAFMWLASTFIGIYKAISGQPEAHQKWMIRSVALAFAAITLRLISPILYEFFNLYTAQKIIYWSCWLINLTIAEYYIRQHLGNTQDI